MCICVYVYVCLCIYIWYDRSGDAQNFNIYLAPGGNLTGRGHIVGVADTGLDLTSCYLHDAVNSTIPYNSVKYVCIVYMCISVYVYECIVSKWVYNRCIMSVK